MWWLEVLYYLLLGLFVIGTIAAVQSGLEDARRKKRSVGD